MKAFFSSVLSRLLAYVDGPAPQTSPAFTAGFVGVDSPATSTPPSSVAPVAKAPYPRARKGRDFTAYAVGEAIDGFISGIEDYGIFVRLPNGESGLVFHSEVSWPNEDVALQIGDAITVLVIGFKAGRGLALSIRQAKVKASFDEFVRSHPVGSKFVGTVKTVLDFGVFVNLAPGVVGLVHVSAIPNIQAYHREGIVGCPISVRVLSVDVDLKRISLGLK